ncbi:hypothetical protein PBI_SEBATA_219 [Mycobacterium phage Sebata]|jgi:hypothetical protein|uniref:Uncharacterized protein n=10 Tax=Bixzunavirus TaxID=680114 RepID=A0A411CCT0_9CAUD|nr:hypothetical protein MOMOMIXON_216 [Mycobacterium phage MoMoMixon]YP_009204744.1 hypothetical protein HYRO_206 [Mycobacterium phage HyRo]YP_009216442.1 hypothetical protein ALICE_205 [Mycobacterium phage Alice]YP_009608870.1 hypothetical protein FDI20_gp129 [Mycobacterium phage Sebata]YP_010058062.1 hypothetical protein KHO62_gp124 [Mycobacterium phage NoodleTree]AFL46874.1 hypothetical protein AVA3_217 [Mycobacterium phage Ava3]AID18267.1 hypothetical protein PBI_WILLIS_219 [Mycobacterium
MSVLDDAGFTARLEQQSLLGGLYTGVKSDLEELADALLRESRRGVTALSEKKDYLTNEQLALRQQREVLNENGFPDPSIRQGLYRRSYNMNAGSRPCRRSTEEW